MTGQAVKNAADKQQVKEARVSEVTQRDTELNDFKVVVSTPAGRRFVGRFLRRTGVFEDTYHPDNSQHSRLAGIRWAGLQLLQDVKDVDPTVLLEALQNYMDEEENDDRKQRAKRGRRGKRVQPK